MTKKALLVLLIGMSLGCSKKTAKPTPVSEEVSRPSVATNNPKNTSTPSSQKLAPKPNWLNKNLEERESPSAQADAGGLPGKPGWGLPKLPDDETSAGPSAVAGQPPGRVGNPVNQQPAIAPAFTPGQPVSEADLKEVWIYIDTRSGASGQMPTPMETLAALAAADSKAAALIRNGSIVLTGSRTRDSVWAYEKNALSQGGLVASHNGVDRVSATDLASRLGR